MTGPKTIEDWLAEAWSRREDCPPPEIFLPSEWKELEDDSRERAIRHLEHCAACSAERDLALAFEAPSLPNPRADREIGTVLDRIAADAERAVGAESGRLLRFPPLSRLLPQRALALAAAALLVVAVAFVLRGRVATPGLPEVPTDDVMRSGRIEVVAPVGDVEAMPALLEWREIDGAETYRVTLLAVDEAVLWSAEVSAPPAALPVATRSILAARVVYFWQVEALDGTGARLAWSSPTAFRLLTDAPQAGETPPR